LLGLSCWSKNPRRVFIYQLAENLIYSLSSIVFGSYSAAVSTLLSAARSLLIVKGCYTKKWMYFFAAGTAVFGLITNSKGLIGLLPVIGNLQYTLAIFRLQNHEQLLKISFLISVASFTVLNIVLYNVVGVIADLTVIVTTVIYLVKGKPESSK
jgi:hypothetical protein